MARPRREFASDAPTGPPDDDRDEPVAAPSGMGDAERYERIGYAGYADARPEESGHGAGQVDEGHSYGAGLVLSDTVTKFDARTEGRPLSFPAGTPVSDLPEWLARDVADNPGLTRTG